ncbi:helix-turn-helix domain-containing protein [Nocardia harenae]|uniref:helix-turn-helix domain-containing protein n=1 Tax=Nocardia harenae TaxID=358707 RepID=UPI00082C5ADC|nr:MerR family transcriptional regulator [Nocardia harenae]
MGWSTRQLAELAGTSLRTVRHYHDVGLLPEPERGSNNYKHYGVRHLVRLLQIKRLTDLGFSLPQIAEMGDADDHPEAALRALDKELEATIERLQRARVELGLLLRHAPPTDLPPELALAAADANLSGADRGLVTVMSRLLTGDQLDSYAELLRAGDSTEVDREFDDLPADADAETTRDLAERMLPRIREVLAEHPDLRDLDLPPQRAAQTIGVALRDLYNPAQLQVMRHIGLGLQSD